VITRLVLLGATGDLAGRFLLPALAWLCAARELPDGLQVVAGAAQDWDDETFRDHVGARWDEHAGELPVPVRAELLRRLRYHRVDPADPATVDAAVRATGATGDAPDASPVAVYLALPPALFPATITALGAAGLPPGSRIAVEKPFGSDLDSAVALNALLARVSGGDEGAVTRVDHFLGMPVVEGLLGLRAAGRRLAPVWNGTHIEQVDVVWEETLGLEGRADFYDRTGAVRDVLQNHLLQVLILLAMELPATGSEQDLHAAKLDLLRSLRVSLPAEPASPADLAACTRRARYTAGTLAGTDGTGDRPVPDYGDEDGVDPTRGTETFAEVVLVVDTPRWAGTRFVLRTGKALGASRKGVALHFRTTAPQCDPRDAERAAPDQLWIHLEGAPGSPQPGAFGNAPGELTAYCRVLTDVLTGGTRTSVSSAETEQAWRLVDPVLAAWAAGAVPLLEYAAGSGGPPPLPDRTRPAPTCAPAAAEEG
jgi:glucose-6-phosphate 1-dehydrogenase